MTNSNGKIKSGGAAGKPTPRIRSATAWRKPSLPTETQLAKEALKEAEGETVTIITGHVTASMSAELERWARGQAAKQCITLSAWLRRLIEREYMRQSK